MSKKLFLPILALAACVTSCNTSTAIATSTKAEESTFFYKIGVHCYNELGTKICGYGQGVITIKGAPCVKIITTYLKADSTLFECFIPLNSSWSFTTFNLDKCPVCFNEITAIKEVINNE